MNSIIFGILEPSQRPVLMLIIFALAVFICFVVEIYITDKNRRPDAFDDVPQPNWNRYQKGCRNDLPRENPENERYSVEVMVCESDGWMHDDVYDFVAEQWLEEGGEVIAWANKPELPKF